VKLENFDSKLQQVGFCELVSVLLNHRPLGWHADVLPLSLDYMHTYIMCTVE